MRIKGKVKYRVKTTDKGKRIRLAIKDGKVVEVKKIDKAKKKTKK